MRIERHTFLMQAMLVKEFKKSMFWILWQNLGKGLVVHKTNVEKVILNEGT